jgi:hypothetical protein
MTSKECEHKHLEVAQGMTGWEAPYDGTDEWWSITCADCDQELAEGDGYSRPPIELMRRVAPTP